MERLRRLRWRRRGAWMWPAFLSLTLGEGWLMHALPIAGDGIDVVPATLLAGFLNLAGVAVLAPLVGRGVRRARPELPRVVADDHAGTALLVLIAVALLAGGLLHRPALRARDRALARQAAAVRDYVLARAPVEFRANLDRADTWRIEDDLFRACVPGRDPRRPLCLYVDTTRSPAAVRVDSNRAPNSTFLRR